MVAGAGLLVRFGKATVGREPPPEEFRLAVEPGLAKIPGCRRSDEDTRNRAQRLYAEDARPAKEKKRKKTFLECFFD